MMGPQDRFAIFFERHIGFGVRWSSFGAYRFELSIAIPFVTINIGIGEAPND